MNFTQPKVLMRSGTFTQSNIRRGCTSSTHSMLGVKTEEETAKLREETFKVWLDGMNKRIVSKREEELKMKQMDEEQKKIRQETAELSFTIWKHKKDRERKAKEFKEKEERRKLDLEKKLKEAKSKELVTEWMKMSKCKVRPVRSNQGLKSLSINPPAFINPRPWINPE